MTHTRCHSRGLVQTAVLMAGAAFASISAADLVILQYHHVSTTAPASTSTTPALFRDQLAMIRELGLEVVPLDQGTAAALAGDLNDQQQVAITFDDAYETVWTGAAPILAEQDMPYTIFVNTDAVGKRGYMTWEQLEQARKQDQVLIANHSHNHGHMARRPEEPEQDWRRRVTRSLERSQDILRQRLDVDPNLFAYPYGEYDEGLEQLIRERDWYGYGQHSGPVGETSAPTRLPRFPMATAYGQLGALPDKLRSRALPIDASTLPDGVIMNNPPQLKFELPAGLRPGALTCFASGQGRVEPQAQGQTVTVQAPEPFTSRRSRYNCTYPAGEGRFYWLSQQWLNLEKPED